MPVQEGFIPGVVEARHSRQTKTTEFNSTSGTRRSNGPEAFITGMESPCISPRHPAADLTASIQELP